MHSFPLYKLFDNPNLDPPKPLPLGALQCDLVTEIEKKKKTCNSRFAGGHLFNY